MCVRVRVRVRVRVSVNYHQMILKFLNHKREKKVESTYRIKSTFEYLLGELVACGWAWVGVGGRGWQGVEQ